MPKYKSIDVERAIELYNKYGSINRAALSMDCSAAKLKRVLVENGVELKKHKPPRLNMNFRNTRIRNEKRNVT